MTQTLFDLSHTSLPIVGEAARFPVGRVFCVGRNYAAHAREMGADPNAEPPLFFMKPASAVVAAPEALTFPSDTNDLHHEVELVLALHKGGAAIAEADALQHVFGGAVGIDLTKRDRQAEAKAKGQPWERAKAFDASAPTGAITPWAQCGTVHSATIALSVNGAVRQSAAIADMIWSPAAIIARLSTLWRLQPGDLIFTGTPEGVGAIPPGSVVDARIDGLSPLSIRFSETPA